MHDDGRGKLAGSGLVLHGDCENVSYYTMGNSRSAPSLYAMSAGNKLHYITKKNFRQTVEQLESYNFIVGICTRIAYYTYFHIGVQLIETLFSAPMLM